MAAHNNKRIGENKENHYISNVSRPFSFQNYFSNTPSPSSTEKIRFNNSRARSHFIMGPAAYKLCPRPTRNSTSMLSKVTTTKAASTCFICGQEFPLAELTAHEKTCLDYIKTNDTQYTRQKSNDDSSNHSFPSTYNSSNLSTHSSSSGESSDKKYSRCYICGTDVPTYLSSIHEKNCKKSWETGLLNSICTPARKSKSKGDVSSVSRSGSRDNLLFKDQTDTSLSTPNLMKSKSSTNIRKDVKDEMNNNHQDNNRPRHLKTTPNSRRGSTPDAKSKSTTNLSKAHSSNSLLSSNDSITTSKSTQDIRGGAGSKSARRADPQYTVCQLCGKLYSVHSISIHQRQCERTYQKQKDVGTNVEYKIKSKSLHDLTGKSSRPKSATPSSRQTPVKTSSRPATANPINRIANGGKSLSASTGNLGPIYKRQLLKPKKDTVVNGDVAADAGTSQSNIDISKTSPGLQKCYLCGQLYGTRSLPIHEKQCLKKWERAQEEEKKKKKKKTPPKKDIQIMAFGRDKFDDDDDDDGNQNNDQENIEPPPKPLVTPSKLFGVPSPLKKETKSTEVSGKKATDSEKKVISNGGTLSQRPTSATSKGSPKFVVCVYCYKQYGLHSIAIHEKNCREKRNVELQTKDRIATNATTKKVMSNKKLSKSVGDITLRDAYTGHDDLLKLVKCDECLRKFLTSDIEKHRLHCRVSVL